MLLTKISQFALRLIEQYARDNKDFDANGNVKKCTDLRVCYSATGDQWPNLNMDPLIKCRVEGIIENEAISRVYWTDNKNPLRTFSLNDPNLHDLEIVQNW